MKKFFSNIIFLISLITLIYSGYKIFEIQKEYMVGNSTYNELNQYAKVEELIVIKDTEEVEEEEKKEIIRTESKEHKPKTKDYPEVNFEALKQINDDVMAWIYLKDTKINYPVVKGDDNDYYLNRMFNKKINSSGSIFLDYRNSKDLEDKHTIIYGHHMKNGSMFSVLTDYKNQDFYEKNKKIYLLLNDKKYEIEVFAGSVCNVEEDAWDMDFKDSESAIKWAKGRKNKSAFNSNIEFSEDDKYISLSTCTYEFDDARFVVHGKLKEIQE